MRGNHLYYDVSDLNAPYDQIPFQGLGGGSLGGSNTLGLGEDLVDEQMPWGKHSAFTVGYQIQLNHDAKARGYCQIEQDGKLGPKTCGLANTLNGSMPSACKSMTAPRKQPCGTPQTGGEFKIDYPWGKPAAETTALQISLNEKAKAAKFVPLAVTGALDAKTCGMVQHFGGTPPSSCQGFTAPTPLPPPAVLAPKPTPLPPPAVLAPKPTPKPTPKPLPYKPDGGDNSVLYAALIALGVFGAAGVGYYAMTRKKGRKR
jgi:hypothetical protein